MDGFVYFSESDEVEEWFENELKSCLKVDFMGDVSWFLGFKYDWSVVDSHLEVRIMQRAYIS